MIFGRRNKLLQKINTFLTEENRDLRELLLQQSIEIARLKDQIINQNTPAHRDIEFTGCSPDGLASMVMRVTMEVEETEQEFIFTTIQNWCLNRYQIIVKKDEIKEMMLQYLSEKRRSQV